MHNEYEIGYGKPPRENQFRKGQSGNPKGRPKGTRNTATIFREVTGQLISVTENGTTRHVTKFEAAMMQLTNQAVKGDFKAIREVLSLSRFFEAVRDEGVGNEPDREKDQATIGRLLARMQPPPNDTSEEN